MAPAQGLQQRSAFGGSAGLLARWRRAAALVAGSAGDSWRPKGLVAAGGYCQGGGPAPCSLLIALESSHQIIPGGMGHANAVSVSGSRTIRPRATARSPSRAWSSCSHGTIADAVMMGIDQGGLLQAPGVRPPLGHCPVPRWLSSPWLAPPVAEMEHLRLHLPSSRWDRR